MEPASSKIAIVTETLCCMSDRDCEAYGVRMIPLSCQVGSTVTGDHIISAEQSVPDGEGRSVPPSEEAYRAHFTGLLTAYDGVLCITASRKFSDSNRHAVLAAAGSDLTKVIKTTCFIADMADFAAFNEVYAKYFTGKPARSCCAVKTLPKNVLCEIEAIAEL